MKAEQWKARGLAWSLTVMAGGCAGGDFRQDGMGLDTEADEPGEVEELSQKSATVDNGLTAVNGLVTSNGLLAGNGLAALNGIQTVNGIPTVNGIQAINGLTTADGVAVTNGLPDGLLSRTTGLLRWDDDRGVQTAQYVVKCALPASKKIRTKKKDNKWIDLPGAIGLAPNWDTKKCDSTCQERVSACLIALTNGKGERIRVELTATYEGIGTDHTSPYHELVAYGNLFTTPPKAFVANGVHYLSYSAMSRMGAYLPGPNCGGPAGWKPVCSNSPTHFVTPYTHTGGAYGRARDSQMPFDYVSTTPQGLVLYTLQNELGRCVQTAVTLGTGTATSCIDLNGATWSNPLTAWRDVPYTGPGIGG